MWIRLENGWKIFLRDRYNHSSPNSAQTEAVCAGALIYNCPVMRGILESYIKTIYWRSIRSIRIEDICQTIV